jgi:type VI protein secretion system component VasF
MWISGRRAMRPDRKYYREVRRKSLRRSRGRQGPVAVFVAGILVVAVVFWFVFKK